jgi:hypothetical protein
MLKHIPIVMGAFAVLSLQAAPARACSTSRRPADTAQQRIAGRTDLRRVIGTYRIERVDPPATDGQVRVHGRITTARGNLVETVQPYHPAWVECAIYYLPVGDASGTFYLSRRPQDGEFELVDWSGQYMAGSVLRSDEGPQ